MANKDSTLRTFTVIGLLCFVCSVLVCLTVVVLKPLQEKEINVDRMKSVLEAAGIDYEGEDITTLFNDKVKARLLDLDRNVLLSDAEVEKVVGSSDAGAYNFVSEAKLPGKNTVIESGKDSAGIKTHAKYMPVYFVVENGATTKVVLPFYGQGLWSTMYGYLAVNANGTTIEGLKYYSQGETAGLGAEVANPAYTAKWKNKKLYDENSAYQFAVKKNADKNSEYMVDAISGATLTSDGVNNSVKYWFEDVYAPFLQQLKNKEVG